MRYIPICTLLGCSLGLETAYLEPQKEDSATEDDGLVQIQGDNESANTQEICNDNLDNDGDALIDCSDPDCVNAPDCFLDNDNDGFFASSDCDDNNPFIYPGATEIANDGIDQDCNGEDYTTDAGGGSSTSGSGSGGPNNSGYESICYNGFDDDGDGLIDCDDSDCFFDYNCYYSSYDYDGDGYNDLYDCNDYDASVYPGAYDTSGDGIDQDCDGADGASSSYESICYDGIDNDGDGLIDCDDSDCSFDSSCYSDPSDYDGDGYDYLNDCNDYDPSIYPGAYDTPGDGIDQDCDGQDPTSSSSCALDGTIYSTGNNAFTSSSTPANNQIDSSCASSNTSEYLVSWTPSQSGCATIDSSTMSADTVLSVYSDCPSQGGFELICDDDSGVNTASELSLDVAAGSTYLIGLEGYSSGLSNAVLNVQLDPTSSCSGASVISCSIDSYLSIGTNTLNVPSNSNQIDQSCGSSSDYNEYLFEWTPSSTGCARFSTEQMSTDTVLSLHLGCPLQGGVEVACDDDGGVSTTSVIEYDVSAGATYYLQLEGYSSDLNTANVTVELDTSNVCGYGGGWDTGGWGWDTGWWPF